MEIAVIGKGESILGFSLAGVKRAYEASSVEEMESKIDEVMKDPTVGILVINQEDFNKLPKRLQSQMSDSVRPTIVAIGTEQSTEMREKIKRAIGVDLWK